MNFIHKILDILTTFGRPISFARLDTLNKQDIPTAFCKESDHGRCPEMPTRLPRCLTVVPKNNSRSRRRPPFCKVFELPLSPVAGGECRRSKIAIHYYSISLDLICKNSYGVISD